MKDIKEQLLEYYRDSYEAIKESDWGNIQIRHYMVVRAIHIGLCHCALEKFGERVGSTDWIVKNQSYAGLYWARTPITCSIVNSSYKEQVLECLKLRIDILSELVKPTES